MHPQGVCSQHLPTASKNLGSHAAAPEHGGLRVHAVRALLHRVPDAPEQFALRLVDTLARQLFVPEQSELE